MVFRFLAVLASLAINCILCGHHLFASAQHDFALDPSSFYESFELQTDFSDWKPAKEDKPFKYIKSVNYQGKWEVTPSTTASSDQVGDYSLKLTTPRGLHAIVKVLDEPVAFDGTTDFVVQYEVKFPENMECGGGYMKLLTFDDAHGVNADNVHDNFDIEPTHAVVFGPDKCLSNSRCHYFLSRFDSKLGTKVMHHYEGDVPIGDRIGDTNLYTLILKSNGKFVVKINGNQIVEGDYSNFTPPVYPPKKIVDPTAVDPNKDYQNYIIDANATKPDDWDENQSELIPDPSETKPEGWLEDVEPYVAPSQELHNDLVSLWDEDLLGPFEAPKVMNEKCVNMMCGTWSPKMISNPEFRGTWTPPIIPNPVPPVEWDPPMVDNPDYVEITNPHDVGYVNAIVFDIWTTDGGIEFDNIYIGHSEAEAKMIADKTFFVKTGHKKSHHHPLASHKSTLGVFQNAKDSLFAFFNTLKSRSLVYMHSPKAVVADIKAIHESAPMSAIISTAISTSLLILYICVLFTKKLLCCCKSQSSKDSKPHTSAKPHEKSKNSNKEDSEADISSNDEEDTTTDPEVSSSNKDNKGLKKRKNHSKSSK